MADKSVGELIAAQSVTPTDLFVLEQNGTAKKLTGQILENWLVSFADGHGGIQSIVKHSTSGLKDTYRITLADTTTFDFTVTNGKAISSVGQTSVSGLTRTYTIAFNDGTSQTFKVTDGRSITNIVKTETNILTDTYTVSYNDGTSSIFDVKNGKGIKSFAKVSTAGLVDTYRIEYNDGTTDEFTVTNGAKGDKGDNTYTHIKFASQEPTESSHSFGDVPDKWIGFYWGSSSTAPTDWTQYKWYQFKGDKGNTGDPAKLTSSAIEYQVSDSGVIIPSGVWSSSVPVVAQGKYMWTRTTNNFNTGNPVVSYSVARMGIDGAGSVSSVANISPDENGNVPLTASDISALPATGGDMTGPINMNGQSLSGLNPPTQDTEAATKWYVDTAKAEAVTYTNAQVKKAAPRNLLDNSDFRNPVNQRGGNNLDRWIFVNSAFSGNTLLSFQSDGIAITNDAGADQVCLYQKFIEKNFDGKTYTAYVLTSNGLYSGYVETIKEDEGMLQCNFWIPTGSKVIWSSIYEGEYTAETLPEYQPKGYGVELAECQRYLQRFRTSDLRKTYCEDFRPTMRMTDTGIVSNFEQSINGVTYYFASTEL